MEQISDEGRAVHIETALECEENKLLKLTLTLMVSVTASLLRMDLALNLLLFRIAGEPLNLIDCDRLVSS